MMVSDSTALSLLEVPALLLRRAVALLDAATAAGLVFLAFVAAVTVFLICFDAAILAGLFEGAAFSRVATAS